MPEICRFEGITIHIYFERESRHLPHFHASYGGSEASFGIDPVDLIAGSLPRRQQRLVEAWAELHSEELMANWARANNGEPTFKIDPLG